MNAKVAMGLDIGYSGLKFVYGTGVEPVIRALPAGAGPEDMLPEQIGEGKADELHRVLVGGQPWVAGVEPHRLQGWSRDLHEDYPSSDTYWALFLAALQATGAHQIDHLVTGLPVEHYQDADRKDRLVQKLTGSHQIDQVRSVTVSQVTVMPQPAGAYMDLVSNTSDLDMLEQGRILVIDPGFYSVDWVTIENGEIRQASSGSSTNATSVLLDTTDQLLSDDYQARAGAERIERAVRSGQSSCYLAGEKVDLTPYITKAKEKIAPRALTEMRQSLRRDTAAVDLILMVGGGAQYYEQAAKEIFPYARVITPAQPELANARGFFQVGV